MLLDIIYFILLILAIIKGYQRGLIVGLCSIVAIIIGLAAAMKLSTVVAGYLENAINISRQWLPFMSFLIVFIIVVILIRFGANLLQKAVEMVMLGWLNRIGGILVYIVAYSIIYSIIVFYAQQVRLIKISTIQSSVFYPFFQPWGPWAINGLAVIIPFFKDMFADLASFFGAVAGKLPDQK